ncbi:sodium:proton antiporter [Cohnella sp.]|uniref:HoxN/HupN/NixA family nickel/cobalt transporter n=1 Tax=Cohnella sp. TaxID=1883426 RepID=UPI003568C49F
MEEITLILIVFFLGIRHGLDADHLAFIDGQTRYNWQAGSPIARWVGTLFSFGHGLVVAIIAIILGLFTRNFEFPSYFGTFAMWIAVISLLAIGTYNLINLLRTRASDSQYHVKGIKGRFIPRMLRETTNPFLIILIGGLFALAAETVSQTAVWSLAAVNSSGYLSLILGPAFMLGMMITDTLNSWLTHRMLTQSSKLGRKASRMMGWLIVTLAYGVAFYNTFTFFYSTVDLDFEIIGLVFFSIVLLSFGFVKFFGRVRTVQNRSS